MARVRVVTWNVHGAVGLDGRRLPARQLGILRQLDADCIALQEFVDHPVPGAEGLLAHWADSLQMQTRVFVRCFERGGACFGNALLSRFPLLEQAEHDISVPGSRRRVVLEAVVGVDSARLHLVNVHCAVRDRPRARQRPRVLGITRRAAGDVTVLLGDFNEWRGWAMAFEELRPDFAGSHPLPTYPAPAPLFALDRIWVRPATCLGAAHVHDEGPAMYASDHLPVFATVEVAPAAP